MIYTDEDMENIFAQSSSIDPYKGFLAEDELPEDRLIPNEDFGECVHWSLAGKGFHLENDDSQNALQMIDPFEKIVSQYLVARDGVKSNPEKQTQLDENFTRLYENLRSATRGEYKTENEN